MKTEASRLFQSFWLALSDVPGWPDAPPLVRFRRLLPILLPCLAALALFGWNKVVRAAQMDDIRAAHTHLVSLEEELAALTLSCSELHAGELTARAAEVGNGLLASPEEAGAWLRTLADRVKTLGWTLTFQTFDASAEPPAGSSHLVHAPARLRMVPGTTNEQPFATLLTVLEHLSNAEKRIELTRMVVRVDEPGKPVVEVNVRLACRVTHEKTPE